MYEVASITALKQGLGYLLGGGLKTEELFDVSFEEEGPLGLNLSLRQSSVGGRGIVVVTSFPRDPTTDAPGKVEGSGVVRIGDELVAVNGCGLPSGDFAAAASLLRSATWPLILRFKRRRQKAGRPSSSPVGQNGEAQLSPSPSSPTESWVQSPLTESEIEAALRFDDSEEGDQRRADAIRIIAREVGGDLILASVRARSSIATGNRMIISAVGRGSGGNTNGGGGGGSTVGLEGALVSASRSVAARVDGAAALSKQMATLPDLRRRIDAATKQALEVGESLHRVELLLEAREERRRQANPFFVAVAAASASSLGTVAGTASFSRSHVDPSTLPAAVGALGTDGVFLNSADASASISVGAGAGTGGVGSTSGSTSGSTRNGGVEDSEALRKEPSFPTAEANDAVSAVVDAVAQIDAILDSSRRRREVQQDDHSAATDSS
mmetsp:Transcript_79890/g.156237  ORF Transcript_79890/g.156237 Transcript_79890/m.156237 type:complete len:439 (-) Transcript_79890:203-1519(-)